MIQVTVAKQFPAARESAAFSLDVAFEAKRGITALFGPSGAGKTLVLDCIAGFVKPDRGRILLNDSLLFDGEAGVNRPTRDRRCGYVLQNYALFPHMTVRENLLFAAASDKSIERHRQVNLMLERFRLQDVAGRKPHQLSGGQRQRCSLARSLVRTPAALLLDEPARGLDAPLRFDLYDIVRGIRAEFDIPYCSSRTAWTSASNSRTNVRNPGRSHRAERPSVGRLLEAVDVRHGSLARYLQHSPVEIRHLDPGRKTSVLRLGEHDIDADYYPGHLKGDRVHLLATPRQLGASPRSGRRIVPNSVPAELERVSDTPDGVRLEFSGGVQVEIPRDAYTETREWNVEFPQRPAHHMKTLERLYSSC
jgi:ABC-type nitrate/sulfonate/bicarbonate transport system ATPase subunit